jgi:hypothetical protein
MSWVDLDGAIYNKLSTSLAALVGTRVYALQAPEQTAYPLVVFQQISEINNASEVLRDNLNDLYQVSSYGRTRAEAASVHGAVHGALNRQALTVSGWTAYFVECENAQRLVEQVGGVQLWRFLWDVRVKVAHNAG